MAILKLPRHERQVALVRYSLVVRASKVAPRSRERSSR